MKILQLSTYPIVHPLHGGQIRVSRIRKFFEEKGHTLKSVSLSEMSHGFYGDDDFLLNDHDLYGEVATPLCTDYATSLIALKGKPFEFLKSKIASFAPDVILVEQAWLWPPLKRLIELKCVGENVRIVYSSHNIEYKTKQSLLQRHDIDRSDIDTVIRGIYELERELCQKAHGVIACTSEDAEEIRSLGARDIVVASNGVAKREADPDISRQLMEDLDGRKYAFFVGSAYPPNALGFWEMLGASLAWLPPEHIIIAAGGVSKILEDYMPEAAKLYSHVSLDRIKRIGFVSEELLASLVENASVIVLPITIGGGSNLKTAEAIAAARPVVATSTACRGFGFTDKLSGFVVTDDQKTFCTSVLSFLEQDTEPNLLPEEIRMRQSVYWENTLKDLEAIFAFPLGQ